MKIPFTNKKLTTVKIKPWRPTQSEIRKSVFADTVPEQIPRLVSTWLNQAYMAGEKAAQEGSNKTDTMKLMAVGALGFMVAFVILKSGLMPA